MKFVFSEEYQHSKDKIRFFIENFEGKGNLFGEGERNEIKIFEFNGNKINIKSFQIPNPINKIVYRFFRKSKAERSFEYAKRLLSKDIGTPRPIAYVEETSAFTFKKSFYASEHLICDLTYRNLVQEPDLPWHSEILRAFTRFTYELHEKQIEFLDHSPGNTLIQLNDGNFKFFLVDLNRMNFKPLSFEGRMKNFSRLTSKQEIVKVMANEYSKLYDKPEKEIFDTMWGYTQNFQKKFHRKKELKRKLKFWKK